MKQPAPKHKHFHNLAYICREIAHRDDFLFFSAMDRDATLSAFEASELWLPDREIWPDSDSECCLEFLPLSPECKREVFSSSSLSFGGLCFPNLREQKKN